MYYLISEFALLPALPSYELESYESDTIEETERMLAEFLNFLSIRNDVLAHSLMRSFLNIPDGLKIPHKQPQLIKQILTHDRFAVAQLALIPTLNTVLVALEETSILPRIGKLWSIIEPLEIGAVCLIASENIWFVRETKEFIEKVCCCLWDAKRNLAILGLDSGYALVISTKIELTCDSTGIYDRERLTFREASKVQIHGRRVLSMKFLNDYIVSIGIDNMLKISTISKGSLQAVGGGSLRQRLGDASLTCLAIDEKSSKIYLGTSINRIFIYKLEEGKPAYFDAITTKNFGPIRSIDINWG